jgi:protein O-mannosyl-transferase
MKLTQNNTTQSRWEILSPLLIVGAAWIAYSNTFGVPFILDDYRMITNSDSIQNFWAFGDIFKMNRPMVKLSFAFNYALNQFEVWGYHCFNLIIHLLAGMTLFGLVRKTLQANGFLNHDTQEINGVALSISVLWVVHPIQTQSVTYITQRAESMMALFYLLTLYAVVTSTRSNQSFIWKSVAVLSCILGMASKAVMISAPITVIIFDRLFLSQTWRDLFKKRRGLYLCLFATWIFFAYLLLRQKTEATAGFHHEAFSSIEYALTQPAVILHYLKLAFWPHPLCFDYLWQPAKEIGVILPPLITIATLFILVLSALRWAPVIGFLGTSFFLILSPTSSVMPISDLVVEHRMYLPLVPIICLFVLSCHKVFERASESLKLGKRFKFPIQFFFVGTLAITLMTLTFQRNQDYSSEVRLWQDTIQKRPNNVRAYNRLAILLDEAGKTDEAFIHLKKAVALSPYYEEARNNLATLLIREKKYTEAIEQLREAVQINPDYIDARNNLAFALVETNQHQEAAEQFKKLTQLLPNNPFAHNNLGRALSQIGNVEESIIYFEKALALKPDFELARQNLRAQKKKGSSLNL